MAESPTARERIAHIAGYYTHDYMYNIADDVMEWIGSLGLPGLAVLLRDAGYDAMTHRGGMELLVAAKESSDG